MSAEYHLAEVARELEGAERAYNGLELQMDRLDKEHQKVRAAVARVRKLHQQYRGVPDYDTCAHCNTLSGGDWVPYPCPTIQALDQIGATL